MSKQRKSDGEQAGPDFGLGGLFKGLGDLVGKLGELAEKGAEMQREGALGDEKGVRGVYGFTVRIGGHGTEKLKVEPFGNIKKDEQGKPTVADEREPIVDVFDEKDCVLVVAELPGVTESEIKTELKGDVLLISASGRERKYRKEILLPHRFEPASQTSTFKNGILEIRLRKGK